MCVCHAVRLVVVNVAVMSGIGESRAVLLAVRAYPFQLKTFTGQLIARHLNLCDKCVLQWRVVQLRYRAALLAHDQNAMLAVRQIVTRCKRINRFNPVH